MRVDFPLFLKAFLGFFGHVLPPAVSKSRTQIRDTGIFSHAIISCNIDIYHQQNRTVMTKSLEIGFLFLLHITVA